ncbi:MAG: hypothetical protein QOD99_219 [Chthoniobacter sp.]|jgi:DNA-binding response OmpR family regulator|nr:hypothetical protein [Chthoniobacter sp.]
MRLLFVEDSERLRRYVGAALKKAGYAVDVCGDGEEGLWSAQTHAYDAIILDLMLPKLDGLTVLERLRASGKQTHVLLLTARDSVEDRVRGLLTGADDYLVKPFALPELLARIHVLCRRGYGTKESSLVVGALEIDTASKTVRLAGKPVELPRREYALLEYLVLRRDEVVSRTEIEAHIHDEFFDATSNIVDSAVCSLRKKITPRGAQPIIQTRRGLGYILASK